MKSNRSFSLDMEEARRRLAENRARVANGYRTARLAAALARTHGVSPLGLDYNGLKRRAEATISATPVAA